MKLDVLGRSRIVILGMGREGLETYRFLRAEFPDRMIGVADRLEADRLAPEVRGAIAHDRNLAAHLGENYLQCLRQYEVIVRSPGVPLITPAIRQAIGAGARVTSHIEIFLANCVGTTVGITGTKGKSTTASLIHAILKAGGLDSHLAGNIGVPPLSLLRTAGRGSYLVLELSSYQLDGISLSPHAAVLLDIVPEHLDLHGGFENYVRAKQNITRFQTRRDFLIYNPTHPIPREIAASSLARRFAFGLDGVPGPGGWVEADRVLYRDESGRTETILPLEQVPLAGRFNLHNVLAAVTAARVLGAAPNAIAQAVRAFKPLPYRLEKVGSFRGVAFYNDPLATIPQAAIAALDALGEGVATMLLGGYDRGLDMTGLARRLAQSAVETVILFPPSGERIWQAMEREYPAGKLPRRFVASDMRTAVSIAYRSTPPGRICLHSPASPSFGLFRDYIERGDLFARYVRELDWKDE